MRTLTSFEKMEPGSSPGRVGARWRTGRDLYVLGRRGRVLTGYIVYGLHFFASLYENRDRSSFLFAFWLGLGLPGAKAQVCYFLAYLIAFVLMTNMTQKNRPSQLVLSPSDSALGETVAIQGRDRKSDSVKDERAVMSEVCLTPSSYSISVYLTLDADGEYPGQRPEE